MLSYLATHLRIGATGVSVSRSCGTAGEMATLMPREPSHLLAQSGCE